MTAAPPEPEPKDRIDEVIAEARTLFASIDAARHEAIATTKKIDAVRRRAAQFFERIERDPLLLSDLAPFLGDAPAAAKLLRAIADFARPTSG